MTGRTAEVRRAVGEAEEQAPQAPPAGEHPRTCTCTVSLYLYTYTCTYTYTHTYTV